MQARGVQSGKIGEKCPGRSPGTPTHGELFSMSYLEKIILHVGESLGENSAREIKVHTPFMAMQALSLRLRIICGASGAYAFRVMKLGAITTCSRFAGVNMTSHGVS